MKQLIRFSPAIFSLAVLLLLSACKENIIRGKGETITKHRRVSTFDKVVIDMAMDATIIVGEPNGVRVKAQNNLHEHIRTEVKNNTLHIHHDGIMLRNDDIEVAITIPSITKLEIKGAADADVKGDVKGSRFDLEVKGASDVNIETLHVDMLSVKLSGASELNIGSGYATFAGYKVTGAGEINAAKLVSKKVTAKVSGASEMSLHVTDSLSANIAGAGEIDYTGHPQISSKVTGAGYLNDRN